MSYLGCVASARKKVQCGFLLGCLAAEKFALKDWPFGVGDQHHLGGTSRMPGKRFRLVLWR